MKPSMCIPEEFTTPAPLACRRFHRPVKVNPTLLSSEVAELKFHLQRWRVRDNFVDAQAVFERDAQ
jgi:hypothetical protein